MRSRVKIPKPATDGEAADNQSTSPSSVCKPHPSAVYKSARTLLKKHEVHNNTFTNEAERRAIVSGYVIIMVCNLLSCYSLFLYMSRTIAAADELKYEVFFLLFKGVCEMYQGKFSWALLLHHASMIFGFWFNMHASLQCFSWIVVHQQYVHLPFALRAMWRLTLPALGYIESEMSWRRRGVSNFFWMFWMFVVGYRTPLITLYGLFAAYAVNDQQGHPMVWQGLLTFFFGLIILNLDRLWTKAMWPKKAKPTMLHAFYFHVGARFMFVAGIFTATCVMFAQDLEFNVVPEFMAIRLTGIDNLTTIECLAQNGFALDSRPDRLNRFKEFFIGILRSVLPL